MARPAQMAVRSPLTTEEIDAASYEGSREHKVTRWWGGLPGAFVGPGRVATRPKKQLTTICPLVTTDDRSQASAWVRHALVHRQYRYYEGDKTYPKHLWHKDEDDRYWFGFCINGTSGTYKGWPVDEVEKREKFG